MHINKKKSVLLISMPNSAIAESQMHDIPLKHKISIISDTCMAVGGVKKFFCDHLSRIKATTKLIFVLNSLAYIQRFIQSFE